MQNTFRRGRRQKTKTSELYEIAQDSGTEIICCDLPQTQSVSVKSCTGDCYIGIDPFQIETEAEERVHLAHELGHCETGAFYTPYSPLNVRGRHECRADRWAASKLVPPLELKKALSLGIVELWELAEYFDVTEEFMEKTMQIYCAKNILHL